MVLELNSMEDLGAALGSNEKLIIDLWAPWCGPCKALAPIFEALSDEYKDVRFAKIDVQAIPDAASMFGVRGIPAVLGFHNGDEVARVAGNSRDKLVAALDSMLIL